MTLFLVLLLPFICSCGAKKQEKDQGKTATPSTSDSVAAQAPSKPAQLPVRYQSPGFVTSNAAIDDDLGEKSDDYQIKVGATIKSTGNPLPLENILNKLANSKGMNVTWASDVNQYANVNVNISADENFFKAIENLLRQVDYFYEVKGKTIVVRNKDTKIYQVGVPAVKGEYTSTVGGNFLQEKTAGSGATEGNVKIKSDGNKFDIWDNVEANLKIILGIVSEGEQFVAEEAKQVKTDREASAKNASLSDSNTSNVTINNKSNAGDSSLNDKRAADGKSESTKQFKFSNRQTSREGEFYVIDKSVGMITVTAKPANLKNVDEYISRLKKELFRQVAIEAKIIEVTLNSSSSVGIDWSAILNGLNVNSTISFGNNGQVYPHTPADPRQFASTFVSRVVIDPLTNFSALLHALESQGDAHVLANPKLTVLNGQPAIISIGTNVAYVKKVSKQSTQGAGITTDTFTAEPDNVVQGIALGIMASIMEDKKVNLHLTPITTDIQNLLPDGSIPLTTIGGVANNIQLGLPQVRVREVSTMVQVENGEMLIIGGLIDSKDSNNGNFAPGIGNIPGLKYLFGSEQKNSQKRELVILLTPKII